MTPAARRSAAVTRYLSRLGFSARPEPTAADVPADTNTSGYIAGADRTLPPRNQTVGLSCG
jgi:hypothetical protein